MSWFKGSMAVKMHSVPCKTQPISVEFWSSPAVHDHSATLYLGGMYATFEL